MKSANSQTLYILEICSSLFFDEWDNIWGNSAGLIWVLMLLSIWDSKGFVNWKICSCFFLQCRSQSDWTSLGCANKLDPERLHLTTWNWRISC